jgi:hypothetical protein
MTAARSHHPSAVPTVAMAAAQTRFGDTTVTAFEKVRRDRKAMRTMRCRLELALATGTQTIDLQQLAPALLASLNATRNALHRIKNRLRKSDERWFEANPLCRK